MENPKNTESTHLSIIIDGQEYEIHLKVFELFLMTSKERDYYKNIVNIFQEKFNKKLQ